MSFVDGSTQRQWLAWHNGYWRATHPLSHPITTSHWSCTWQDTWQQTTECSTAAYIGIICAQWKNVEKLSRRKFRYIWKQVKHVCRLHGSGRQTLNTVTVTSFANFGRPITARFATCFPDYPTLPVACPWSLNSSHIFTVDDVRSFWLFTMSQNISGCASEFSSSCTASSSLLYRLLLSTDMTLFEFHFSSQ